MFCTGRCYKNCHQRDYHVAQLRHLLNVPIVVCTFKWKGQKAGLYKHWRPKHMCDLDVYLSTRLQVSTKNTNDRETVNSLQLENQWLRDESDDAYGAYLLISVWNLLEKAWFKKCAQKRNFLDKNLWHIVLICIRRVRWLATHQSQSSQNTPSLEYKVVEQPPTWPILCRQ